MTSASEQATAASLLYVADPMCSWCWGFHPVVSRIRDEFDLPLNVRVGGLRPGPAAQALDARLAGYLRSTWSRIAELTGQPFDSTPLSWEGWVYDTELPARAVVTMRELAPNHAFELFGRIQQAFYADAVDVTKPEAYPPLVRDLGVDPDAFQARLAAEDTRDAAWADFDLVRQMGVTGFPALFLIRDRQAWALTLGYRPVEQVREALRDALGPVY